MHQPFVFFSENYGYVLMVWYKNLDIFFFRLGTVPAFVGQTDGRTDTFLATRPPCIQCSAVKTKTTLHRVV